MGLEIWHERYMDWAGVATHDGAACNICYQPQRGLIVSALKLGELRHPHAVDPRRPMTNYFHYECWDRQWEEKWTIDRALETTVRQRAKFCG